MGRCPTECTRGGLAGGGQKGGFKAAIEAEIVAEIEALVGEGAVDDWDFEAIETATRRQTMCAAARAVERRINADISDHTGATALCACGQAARYAGRRAKTFESVLGPLPLERAYYHCDGEGIAETRRMVHRLIPVLAQRERQLAGTLSGGEQQMLAIGRALMAAPRLLLLDEPSLGLSPLLVREIFRTLGEIKQTGVTVLLVEEKARAALREDPGVRKAYLGRVRGSVHVRPKLAVKLPEGFAA